MALCHNCDDVRDQYTGNGVQKEYKITFEYYDKDDVAVAYWDEDDLMLWKPVPNTEWVFKNETVIRFNTAPAYGQKFIIYRCTDLEPLPSEFYPGTPIKAQDLNDNFFVLKSAIEEARCAINRNDGKSEDRYWNKVTETITYEDQTTGKAEAKLDDKHIFDAKAIAARHDAYVQDNQPQALTYEQSGKIWNDTDDLVDYFWDPNGETWVSFTKSGPAGPRGPFGPPGKVIVSDSPPTVYPAVDSNDARPLESGDMWFDSYNVLLYVFYIDNHGPGQWVSVTTTGPQGPPGEKGDEGGIADAPADGELYGRKDNDWEVIAGGGGDVPEAPIDGKYYCRKDGDWEEVEPFSRDYNDLINTPDIPPGGGGGGEILTFTAPLVKAGTNVSLDLQTIPNTP